MAESLAHRWGQIVGDVFEAFVRSLLADVANRHDLYLDHKRRARASQGGKNLSKVTWQDGYGNRHDLDYVLERGGTQDAFGTPVAFIESAWRRYTKHSKNKAQEIEAAVRPVAQTFSRHQPFCGAVLAGEFTRMHWPSWSRRASPFFIFHTRRSWPLPTRHRRFLGRWSSGTTEEDFRKKIALWESLPQPQATNRLLAKLHALHQREIADFKQRLEAALTRQVASIRLTVLRGHSVECPDIESAIAYLIEEDKAYRLREEGEHREAFEVQVRFNTGARIEATFPKRAEAIAFLRSFA